MMPLTVGVERLQTLALSQDAGMAPELTRELEVLRLSVRPMVAPPVRLASLRLLHAAAWLAQPWQRSGAGVPLRNALLARRAQVAQARAQLDEAVAANPGVRAVPPGSAEAAVVALQAWLVLRRVSTGGGAAFAEPQVRLYAGLPTGLDGGVEGVCAARLRHEPAAPVAGEYASAGGCALVSFGTAQAADAALAAAVAAPGARGTVASARWEGGGFQLQGGPE
jgi:hypothetical protein